MKKITIKNTDLELSPMGMGCVNAGIKWDGEDAFRIFDAFLDMGGTVYDTARVYADWIPSEIGRSERVLGQWLRESGKRHDIILVSKGGHPDMTPAVPDMHASRISAENMRHDLELSLRALGTDYIDVYFYHRDNEAIPASELIEVMEEFRKEGKIRYYACSNWSTARMREADSDIIVGFPGETYEEFCETLSLIREVEFTSLFTFIFSPRPGTRAAEMEDPVTYKEKTQWFSELLKTQEEIAAKRCASMVGSTERVLIEERNEKNGLLSGRTASSIIVEFPGEDEWIGEFKNVKVTEARNWILRGECVD